MTKFITILQSVQLLQFEAQTFNFNLTLPNTPALALPHQGGG